jgi:hypothetical protein
MGGIRREGEGKKKKKKKKKKRKGPHLNALNERSCRYYSRDTKDDCLLRSDKVACPIPVFVSHVLNN